MQIQNEYEINGHRWILTYDITITWGDEGILSNVEITNNIDDYVTQGIDRNNFNWITHAGEYLNVDHVDDTIEEFISYATYTFQFNREGSDEALWVYDDSVPYAHLAFYNNTVLTHYSSSNDAVHYKGVTPSAKSINDKGP